MKYFTPIASNDEDGEKWCNFFNEKSNQDNPDKFKKRVFSVSQMNVKLELIHYDKIDGNFPDSKIPIVAIIETDTTFDIYGLSVREINGKDNCKYHVHSIQKSLFVVPEYFD